MFNVQFLFFLRYCTSPTLLGIKQLVRADFTEVGKNLSFLFELIMQPLATSFSVVQFLHLLLRCLPPFDSYSDSPLVQYSELIPASYGVFICGVFISLLRPPIMSSLGLCPIEFCSETSFSLTLRPPYFSCNSFHSDRKFLSVCVLDYLTSEKEVLLPSPSSYIAT